MAPCSVVEKPRMIEKPMNLTPRKNLVFAVNYELSIVDQFLAESKRRKRSVEPVENSTNKSPATNYPTLASISEDEQKDSSKENKEISSTESFNTVADHVQSTVEKTSGAKPFTVDPASSGFRAAPNPTETETPDSPNPRRSAREKPKRGAPLARSRVRYDMQLVPPANRNRDFLRSFKCWWNKEDKTRDPPTRRSSRLSTPAGGESGSNKDVSSCETCLFRSTCKPFEDDSSIIWIPSKRSEWEDTVSELVAVCTSAAVRRYRSNLQANTTAKPFHAPLSRDYIRDRIDIDDPLNGYQLRHREGGWLQGFVLWTNFTTWSYYFKWDSLHAASGFANLSPEILADVSGELANELEGQPRSGDPHGGGIVFPTIAEIGLLGGLGCGEYMLRMALEDILASKKYRYVVLQATDSSKSFYERFGFVRVGAVCRYGKAGNVPVDTPLQGYRHWTHANESERSLQKHGGPSYMMCLKLPEKDVLVDGCPACEQKQPVDDKPAFLKRMLDLAVDEKPTIEQMGVSGSTPASKSISRRNSTASLPDVLPSTSGKRGRPPSTCKSTGNAPRRKSVGPAVRSSPVANGKKVFTLKHSISMDSAEQPPHKRRRVASPALPREDLLTPPRDGKALSYAQKQYQSVWLAVPPTTDDSKLTRPPPKRRSHPDNSSPPPLRNSRSAKKARSASSSFPLASSPPRGPRRESVAQKPLALGDKSVTPIEKTTLLKQKVKAYPRSRIHYYNRVVKRMVPNVPSSQSDRTYFFVLQYDEPTGLIKIVPMSATGRLTGKREGRPRYQAEIGETDENFLIAQASDFEIVSAAMVMKTPVVAHEAWDVEDDN